MDRITDAKSPRVSREVRPVARLSPSKPVRSGEGDAPSQAPYGVVDRVTLSPEGRAMAEQQRASRSAVPAPKTLTYGPGSHSPASKPRLPYTPDS